MKLAVLTQNIKHVLEYSIPNGRAYAYLLILILIFFLPVLIANTDYIDDNARAVSGYYDWGSLGRFVTEGLMRILTFSGATMADPGRLMQILSIPVLALAGYIFARTFAKERSKVTVTDLLVAAPIVLNPFLLANFAFRYDSLSMILAYALAVLAGCSIGLSKTRLIAGVVLVFIVAALYQPMVMMFATTAVLLWMYRSMDSPSSATYKLGYSVVAFIAGTGLYFVILRLFSFSNVGGESRGVLVSLNKEGLLQALSNFKNGIDTILLMSSNGAGKALALLIVAVIVVGVAEVIYRTERSKRLIAGVTLLVSLPLLAATIMGPFIFMNSALTYQVRTLSAAIGIVVFMAILGLVLARRKSTLAAGMVLATVAIFSFYVVSLSYNFGGALAAQREHDTAVYDEIDDYMLRNDDMQMAELIYVGGLASRPDSVNDMLAKRPFLGRMEVANDNSTWYIWQRLNDANVTPATVAWYTQTPEQEALRWQLCQDKANEVYAHPYFSVYRAEKVYIIWQHDPANEDDFCNASITGKRSS